MPDRLRMAAVITNESVGAVSGVRTAFERLCAALAGRGHRIDVAAAPEIVAGGPQQQRESHAATGRQLEARWAAERPDLVHIELAGNVGRAALEAAHRLGLPVSSAFHHLHLYAPPAQQHRVFTLLGDFHRHCAATVTESEASRRMLEAMGVAGTAAIGRGVDGELFRPARRDSVLRGTWGAGADDPVLFWAGRLVAQKGPALLAAACTAARARVPGTRVVIVGDGPEAAALRAALPWAVFTGVLNGEALARAYASADIFVFSSPNEPYGNAVLEAAASGLAVVARSGGAAADVLGPVGGCVMPLPHAEDDFIRAVADLAADAPRRAALAAVARQAVEPRTWDAVAAEWEVVFRRVAALRKR